MSSNAKMNMMEPEAIAMRYVRNIEEDPRYMKFKEAKAIPFFFQLGFHTVSLGPPVMATFKEHWIHHSMPHNSRRIHGICFGKKIGNGIQIQQIFHFRYDSFRKILIRNNEYNTDLEFFGIYSNGDLIDDVDVSILQSLCQSVAQSVFLIKFNWSNKLNDIQKVEVFENVFDIASSNLEARIISMQAFKHHPKECLLTYKNNESCPEKIFYIAFYEDDFADFTRFDLNISPSQKVQLEQSSELFRVSPTFMEYRYIIYKHVFTKGIRLRDLGLRHTQNMNCLKLAREFCGDLKVDLRFKFYFSPDRDGICSTAGILNWKSCSIGKTVAESVENAAIDFLRVLVTGQYLKYGTMLVDGNENQETENRTLGEFVHSQ